MHMLKLALASSVLSLASLAPEPAMAEGGGPPAGGPNLVQFCMANAVPGLSLGDCVSFFEALIKGKDPLATCLVLKDLGVLDAAGYNIGRCLATFR